MLVYLEWNTHLLWYKTMSLLISAIVDNSTKCVTRMFHSKNKSDCHIEL